MTTWQLYWLTRLDGIVGVFVAISLTVGIGLIVGLLVTGLVYSDSSVEEKTTIWRRYVKALAIGLPVLAVSLGIAVFVPTTKEMAFIWVAPRLAQSIEAQAIPDKLIDLANAWIEELKPKEKKSK